MPALLAALAGCVLLVVAVVYFAVPAHSLPSFFPGHVSAGDAEANHHHVKHGIAALAVALARLRVTPGFRPARLRAKKSPEPGASTITYLQAAILGLLQGIAEPFPVSSLGHGVILPRLLGWDIHQNDDFFLAFLVATHLATALVLFVFFLRTGSGSSSGIVRSLREREIRADDVDARLGWLLVVGTIPVGLIGLLAEKSLRSVFASPASAAVFLARQRDHAARRRAPAAPRRGHRQPSAPTSAWPG